MNETLQNWARQSLKEGLKTLPEANQLIFKRMYSPHNLEADIDDVVDNMPVEKLDWAMQQVDRTISRQNA